MSRRLDRATERYRTAISRRAESESVQWNFMLRNGAGIRPAARLHNRPLKDRDDLPITLGLQSFLTRAQWCL